MRRSRKSLLALAFAMLLAFSVSATETAAPTEPAVIHYMDTLPGNFSPLSERTAEKAFILDLTTDSLYKLSADGSTLIPSMAAAMPVDVTAEYAGGIYGVPADAVRGYAFRIDLDPAACWEDGTPITADDYLFTVEQRLEEDFLYLANAADFLAGRERLSENIISLEDCGYTSVAEAQAAGVTAFYVDMTHFWGLDSGWQPLESRTRYRDYAMPSGMNECFVTPAYLYRNYLADDAGQAYYQSEFVGISAEMENRLTFADVGILKTGDDQLTLILEAPTTATALALKLENLYLFRQEFWGDDYGTTPEQYCSYGPYRLVSASYEQIVLERNEYWHGDADRYPADTVLCKRPAGD